MARPDDPKWEDEFAEDTKLDRRDVLPEEAVPAPVEERATGKYKTLSYASPDVRSELAYGRGVAHTTKKILLALKLRLIASGTHPAVADEQVEGFRQWMEDPTNAELIRVAMKD